MLTTITNSHKIIWGTFKTNPKNYLLPYNSGCKQDDLNMI